MISAKTRDKWKRRIKYCKKRRVKMNDSECDFMRYVDVLLNFHRVDLSLEESFRMYDIYYKLEKGDI